MAAFDPDVRGLVQVHVVHGFWKREDPSRLELQVGRPFFCSSEQSSLALRFPPAATRRLTSARRRHLATRMSLSTMPTCLRCLAPITPR
jgi:hypothetical protein